jgi:hypothetical protein
MRVIIIYESMYGNTRQIAHAIGVGLERDNQVTVVPVAQAGRELLAEADLVVTGGPTHVHGMSRPNSRREAVQAARKPGSALALDPDAGGPGLREWFASFGQASAGAAAFDTRLDGPAAFTGRASKDISRQLHRHGLKVIAEPVSFLVTRDNTLLPGELDRAEEWGEELATRANSDIARILWVWT